MKLFSTKTDKNGKQLVCEDAIFDPALLTLDAVDFEEKCIIASYDIAESGNPLSLPFYAETASIYAVITPYDIHLSAIVELDDEVKSEFASDTNEVELNIRMSAEEKFQFVCAIFNEIFTPTPEDNENDASDKDAAEKQQEPSKTETENLDAVKKVINTKLFNDIVSDFLKNINQPNH